MTFLADGARERRRMFVQVPRDDPHDAFNGVRLVLPPEPLGAFRIREHGYDLVPFVVLPWRDLVVALTR